MPRVDHEAQAKADEFVARFGEEAYAEAAALFSTSDSLARSRPRQLLEAVNAYLDSKGFPKFSQVELDGTPPTGLIPKDAPDRKTILRKMHSPERITLRQFVQFAISRGVRDVRDVSWALIERFLASLEGRKGGRQRSSTKNRKQNYLRSFFWAQHIEGSVAINLVPKPIEDVPLPRAPTWDEFRGLRTAVAERAHAENVIRDLLLLDAPATTGLRLAELVALKKCDILPTITALHVENGKGGKERYQPAALEMRDRLLAYAENRLPDQFVFSADGGNHPLHPSAVEKMFDRALRQAGIEKSAIGRGDLTYHSLRHLYGTTAARVTNNQEQVRQLMGHASVESAKPYMQNRLETMMPHVEGITRELRDRSDLGKVVGPVRKAGEHA